jgi:hypothetical protein
MHRLYVVALSVQLDALKLGEAGHQSFSFARKWHFMNLREEVYYKNLRQNKLFAKNRSFCG